MKSLIILSFLTCMSASTFAASINGSVQTKPEPFDGPDGKGAQIISQSGAHGGPGGDNASLGAADEAKTERLKAQIYKNLNANSTLDRLGPSLWKE